MIKSRDCHCRLHWKIRNDSSKVAALLKPDTVIPRNNNCYCTEKGEKPQLFSKPKECHTEEGDGAIFRTKLPLKMPQKCQEDDNLLWKYHQKDQDDNTFGVKMSQNYQKSDDFQRKYYQNIQDFNSQIKIPQKYQNGNDQIDATSRTKVLHKIPQNYQDGDNFSMQYLHRRQNGTNPSSFFLPQIFEKPQTEEDKISTLALCSSSANKMADSGHDTVQERGEGSLSSATPIRSHSDIIQSIDYLNAHNKYSSGDNGSKAHYDPEAKYNQEDKLKQLSDFRKDHYFDTHSTEDLIKTVPDHVCVHKFELDDRFLAKAMNADAFGESRCIICGKMMEKPTLNRVDERMKRTSFPKFYKYGLAPKKVFLGDDKNVKVEMVLPKDEKLNDFFCKSKKKPNYFNTYALKYQKGVA